MSDLFLEPKVLNYQADKYQLILLTLRWARALKAKGTPETMPVLIEKALREIVEGRVTKEEILANKLAAPPPVDEIPAVVSVAGEADGKEIKLPLPPDDDEEKKPKAKKKKK